MHDFFGVPREKRALRHLAEASARESDIPLAEVIERMREELVALPVEWPPGQPPDSGGVGRRLPPP